MKRLATAPLVLTALLLGSCDTSEKVLGSFDNPNPAPGAAATPQAPAPANPSGTQPPPGSMMPPAPPSSGTAPMPPPVGPGPGLPQIPPIPMPRPPSPLYPPPGYPPGPYGYKTGETLASYLFITRDNHPFSPDSVRTMSGIKVLLLLQTTEGCCPVVRRLNEINDEFAPKGLFIIQLVTRNRSGQAASAQTLIDWDQETGYKALSVYGGPMKELGNNVFADTPSLVVAHIKDMKIQTFASGAAIGGVGELRAAVQAALATAP